MKIPSITRLLLPALAFPLLMLAGCGDSNTPPANADRTGPAADRLADKTRDAVDDNDASDPDALDPGTLSDPAWDAAEDLDEPEAPQTPVSPAVAPTQPDLTAGRVATINGSARLPFPEEGERISEHLTFTKLAEHDAFENPIDPEDIPEVVPWEEAGQYVGHTITVEGKIVDVGQTRTGSVFFLNFHQDWRGKFYLVVFEDLAETLEDGVEGTFLNKLIRVEGLVEDHRGRPQIKIESMDQVEFVEE